MRSVLRTAVIVLAVLGGLAIIQTLVGAGNRPQIVYVTAPAPTPAPAPQVIVRREVVQVEQSPTPEPVQYESSAPVEYTPPQQVYSAPMAQSPVIIERESPSRTRTVIVAGAIGIAIGAAIANRRGGYGNNRYSWGGGQFGGPSYRGRPVYGGRRHR